MDDEKSMVKTDQWLGHGAPPEPEERSTTMRLLLVAAAAAVALVSFFVLGKHFSQPQAYGSVIASLDAKKDTVMNLVGASTGSSAAITVLPGDVGTPIAEKLIDLSSDFMIVLAAIYLEKYLLTVLGFVSFRVLVPVSCAFYAAAQAFGRRSSTTPVLTHLASKLLLFAITMVLVVPCSVFVSDMIERTYKESIDQTIAIAEQTQEEAEAVMEDVTNAQEPATTNIWETIAQLPDTFSSSVTETVNGLTEEAQSSLKNFIEALAVMLVTSCVIPLLVLVFFVWLMRVILGINIDVPAGVLVPRSVGRRFR